LPATLPAFYAITAPLRADGSNNEILDQPSCLGWLEKFERLISSDVSLVQFRVKDLEFVHLEALTEQCQALAGAQGVRLLLNGPTSLAQRLGMARIHLTSDALMQCSGRPLPDDFMIGASCHSPKELAAAEAIGADFACLSPVKVTRGYSADEILGFDRFGEWASNSGIPVFGLGGLVREDLGEIVEAGGQGVAGISAFW